MRSVGLFGLPGVDLLLDLLSEHVPTTSGLDAGDGQYCDGVGGLDCRKHWIVL